MFARIVVTPICCARSSPVCRVRPDWATNTASSWMPISIVLDACAVPGQSASRARTRMGRRARIAGMLARDAADLGQEVRTERAREARREVGEVLVGEHAADHREAVLGVAEVAAEVDRRRTDPLGGCGGGVGRERGRARRGTGPTGRLPLADGVLDARERVRALLRR